MTCCFKRGKRKLKKYSKNTILPYDPKTPLQDYRDKLNKEIIYCFHCKERFHLQDNQIKIHCNGCSQFFHCHIAGKCVCDECQGQLSYCKDCISYQSNDTQCLCKLTYRSS